MSAPYSGSRFLGRRRLLQLGLGAGVGLALPPLLASCRRADGPRLLAVEQGLPSAWLRQLPSPWQLQQLSGPQAVVQGVLKPQGPVPGLVALPDGWAADLPVERLQSIAAPALFSGLLEAAQPVARLYRQAPQPPLAFPWSFSPWVIALRSRPRLAAQARDGLGWRVLEDPSLRGRLVLPSSPRVSIEICRGDLNRLHALRAQALAYDDANALNLLLTGEAVAAVVPLQRLIPLLRRDQRLEVVLPATGAPLTWQVLVRPAASSAPLPLPWLEQLWSASLLPRLLAAGWVPPLSRARLESALATLPGPVASLLLPPVAVLQRCWSLPPLSPERRLALQTLWDAAA